MQWNQCQFFGVYQTNEEGVVLASSASGFRFRVEAQGEKPSLTLYLNSAPSYDCADQYVALFFNGRFEEKICCGRGDIPLGVSLPASVTEIQLLKLNEHKRSILTLKGIATRECNLLEPPAKREVIDFYGDSLSCGYGVLGHSEDSFSSDAQDICYAYPFLLAERFRADAHIVGRSGIRLVPSPVEEGFLDYLLEVEKDYPRGEEGHFAIINLGTNDAMWESSSWMEGYATFKERYRENMNALVERIVRNKYIEKIVFVRDMMTPFLPTFIQTLDDIVTSLRSRGFRAEVVALKPDQSGGFWHPGVQAHEQAAEKLQEALLRP